MKPLRAKISEAAAQAKVPEHVIEKDYALSYILAGISAQKALHRSLVFKGGTALKKLFFGQYRFSEDLDYSTIKAPRGKELAGALEAAGLESKRRLLEYGPFEVVFKRYEERDPHPHGQEAFTFNIQFPWHPSPLCRIKIEISHDEPVILKPEDRPLIHGYEESLEVRVQCYQLPEIVAEKLRTLLQTHQKLAARGWNQPRARDYYDLWRLFSMYGDTIDWGKLLRTLRQKCEHRKVSFRGAEDFFTEELLSEAKTHWTGALGAFVSDLPPFQKTIDDLREILADIVEPKD